MRKKKEHAEKLKASISENPKRFWSYIKSSTSDRPSPNFFRDGHKIVTDSRDRANILNKFFSSVFNPASTAPPPLSALPPNGVGEELDSIEITTSEVREVLLGLGPNKACRPDIFPGSLLKNTAAEIAPSCVKYSTYLCHMGWYPRCGNVQMALPFSKRTTRLWQRIIDRFPCFA